VLDGGQDGGVWACLKDDHIRGGALDLGKTAWSKEGLRVDDGRRGVPRFLNGPGKQLPAPWLMASSTVGRSGNKSEFQCNVLSDTQ
jgi:hypothetical protein